MLEKLVAETAHMIPDNRHWEVFYLGFSRSGWTEQAAAYAAKITQTGVSGNDWTGIGMRLLTLDDVDRDLHNWVR
jgi:hypothetical protein